MARPFVMPEDAWIRLCAVQCAERRREYGDDRDYCEEHDGICPECASDAAAAVPARYRTTAAKAAQHDTLPGLDR